MSETAQVKLPGFVNDMPPAGAPVLPERTLGLQALEILLLDEAADKRVPQSHQFE